MTGKMSQGYLIDATARTVTAVEFDGLEGLQKMIGGWIEAAYGWANQDTLFVDEEGLLKRHEHFFWLLPERPDQPFAGNGVLVGREDDDETVSTRVVNHPPTMTLDELRVRITFVGSHG